MDKVKKPFYKKWWFFAIVVFVIMGIIYSPSEEEQKAEIAEAAAIESAKLAAEEKKLEAAEAKQKEKQDAAEQKAKQDAEAKVIADDEKKAAEKLATTVIEINTSVFEYATDIKLTDAIDINQHVTVMVDMSEELTPGLATQHVVNQTYDFVQQDDVQSAKTITLIVRQAEKKVAQYTINTEKFKPNDDEPMADAVISASEIDSMTDEVKEFGKTMGTW